MLATLTINVASDFASEVDNGLLTLREAISAVNGTYTPTAQNGDTVQIDESEDPLGQNDAIVFASNLDGATINLNPNFGMLVIANPVNILGPASKVTIRPSFVPTNEMYGLNYLFAAGDDSTLFVTNLNISGFTSGIRVSNLSAGSHLFVSESNLSGNNAVADGQPLIGGAGIEIISGERVTVQLSTLTSNRRYGVYVHNSSSDNLVSLQGNQIAINTFAGVYFEGANRPFNFGNNNTIVDTPSGPGIRIANSSHAANSRIEGGNVIGGNLVSGILLSNADYPNLIIQQNTIGVDSLGQVLPNGTGIEVNNGSQFGSILSNVISSNNGNGIILSNVNGGLIRDNDILFNRGAGIRLGTLVQNVGIDLNIIASNTGAGVFLENDAGDGNQIVTNGFGGNGGLPIDLEDENGAGFTENDPNDTDPGPNDLLNYVVLGNPMSAGGGVWNVDVAVDVDKTGLYRAEFCRLNQFGQLLPIQDAQMNALTLDFDIQSLNSMGFEISGTMTILASFQLAAGESFSAVLFGVSGDNARNTSEFSPAITLGGPPPRITDVVVWKNSSRYSFAEQLSSVGGAQLKPIFYDGIDRIDVQFSQNVIMDGSELVLDATSSSAVPSYEFTYDPVELTATWLFDTDLSFGKYSLRLSDTIMGTNGLRLDGGWANPVNTPDNPNDGPSSPSMLPDDDPGDQFPSGEGTEGGSFRFHFGLLPGDFNQDGIVNGTDDDAGVLKDGNGDGVVNSSDVAIVTAAISGNRTWLPITKRGGDFRDDEIVDEADYELWKMTFGSMSDLRADGNGDGTVNAADYTIWRNNLGGISAWSALFGAGGGGGAGVVPIVLFGEAPRVANVTISGSNTTHAPYSFDAHDGSGEQLRTVPVGAADTISITFTEDVNLIASDLRLVGLRTANRPTLADFSYDLSTMTATWRFTGWALGDQYVIRLRDAVTDVEGNPLDGEWTNPMSLSTTNALVSEFPSGDGEAGGDFNFIATLLAGDANLDLVVDNADAAIIYYHWNLTSALFTDGDFDGSGNVSAADGYVWNQFSGTNLQNLSMLGDLNGDWVVDESDSTILYNNWHNNVQNPTQAQGDLDGDGNIDVHDLDVMFAQFGLALDVVS
jgi:hypothetical protein